VVIGRLDSKVKEWDSHRIENQIRYENRFESVWGLGKWAALADVSSLMGWNVIDGKDRRGEPGEQLR